MQTPNRKKRYVLSTYIRPRTCGWVEEDCAKNHRYHSHAQVEFVIDTDVLLQAGLELGMGET